MATSEFQEGGVIFLLWDEGGGTPAEDDPPFIAISPNAKAGYVSHEDYNGSSYLKTVETLLGVEPLPCNPAERDATAVMSDLFTVPLVAASP
jgi:hypothetical protein